MQEKVRLPLSVTILAKNSEKYIAEVLKSLIIFDEVLLCDTGSSDQTIQIAQSFDNVVIKKIPFVGFGPTHNQASHLAKHDWILSIDSDEVMTSELLKEISNLVLTDGCVYSFPRRNYYKGKWIKWCGWHPDRVLRLYNKKQTQFTDVQVHESINTDNMNLISLENPIRHYSYSSCSDFLEKMQSYSTLFAQQNIGKKKSSLLKAIGHGLAAFFKSYVIKRGFLGGAVGFEISLYNANTAFYKYLKLAELNNKKKIDDKITPFHK